MLFSKAPNTRNKISQYSPRQKSPTIKKYSYKPLNYMTDTLRLKIMGPSLLSTIHKYFNNPGNIPEDKFLAVCQRLASFFCETNNLFTWYLKTALHMRQQRTFLWLVFHLTVFCLHVQKKPQLKNLFSESV